MICCIFDIFIFYNEVGCGRFVFNFNIDLIRLLWIDIFQDQFMFGFFFQDFYSVSGVEFYFIEELVDIISGYRECIIKFY